MNMMFRTKKPSSSIIDDSKKPTSKILDLKKDSASRLKYLKTYIDSTDSNEIKLFFDHYYSQMFCLFYEYYQTFENSINLKAKIKFNKEDLDLLLYTFEKILIIQPERLQQRWQARAIGHLIEKLLHIGNTKTIKIEGTRLFLIWYQILNYNKTSIEELIFQKLIHGFDVFHTQNSSIGLDFMNAEAQKVFNINNSEIRIYPVEISPLIPIQSNEKSYTNLTSELMKKLLESLQKDCIKIEWSDKLQIQKCYEFLYEEFKRYYLINMFPNGFSIKTNETIPTFDRPISDERKSTQINCKEEVLKWLINILYIQSDDDSASSQKEFETLKANNQEENLAIMNEQSSSNNMTSSVSYHNYPSSSTSTLTSNSNINQSDQIYQHLAQRVLFSNATNVNIILEILKQAFQLNFDDYFTIQRILNSYKKWFLCESTLPLFMLEPDNDNDTSIKIGFTRSLQLFFSNSLYLFLNRYNLQRDKIQNILLVTLDIYKIFLKKIQIDYNTWVLIITVLLKIFENLFNSEYLINNRTESSISQLIKSLTETILLAFERASLRYNLSNDVWDQLMNLLSNISTYSDVIDKWIDSIDNLLKYTFKKFYNLDVSNLDIKQEDWTRTRKNKIRANNINTYSSVLPIAGSVPNDNQINVNTSNYNVMRQFKGNILPIDSVNDNSSAKSPSLSDDQVFANKSNQSTEDMYLTTNEDKSSTLKAINVQQTNTTTTKSSNMNRFSSEKSIYYSSDKIDNLSETSTNSSFTTPSSTTSNQSTSKILNASNISANNQPLKPTNLDLPDTIGPYFSHKNSDSTTASGDSDFVGDSRYERNLKSTSLYGDFEPLSGQLDTPSEASDGLISNNDGISMQTSLMSLNNYGSMHSDKSYAVEVTRDLSIANTIYSDDSRRIDQQNSHNAKDILFTLIRRLFGCLGNLNQIQDPTIHKRVFDFIHENWLIFSKCLKVTTNDCYLIDFSPWLFEAIYQLNDEFKEGKLVAYKTLCKMALCENDILFINDDFMDLFYITIHNGLQSNDEEILNCIIENCGIKLWHSQLQSCTLLLLDFMQACNKINKQGPKQEAVLILATLCGYSNYYGDVTVLNKSLEDNELMVDTLSIDQFKDTLIENLVLFQAFDDNKTRNIISCALTCYIYEETISSNWNRKRLVDALKPLFDDLDCKDGNLIRTRISCENIRFLASLADLLFDYDSQYPIDIIAKLNNCLLALINPSETIDYILNDEEYIKTVVSCMFSLLDWYMYFPFGKIKKTEKKILLNNFFRLLNHASGKFKRSSNTTQFEHIYLAAKFAISHLLTQQNHFPFGQSGASKIISSITESSDNNSFNNPLDDLNTSIIAQPNVQFFTVNNQYLLSFMELSNTNKQTHVQYLNKNQNTIQTEASSTICRFLIRDYCGKYCWDSTLLSPNNHADINNQSKLTVDVSVLSNKNIDELEFNSAETSFNIITSENNGFDSKQLPFITNIPSDIDILDNILQYLCHSSPECRLKIDKPLNLISDTNIPVKVLAEEDFRDKLTQQVINETGHYKINYETINQTLDEFLTNSNTHTFDINDTQLLSYYRLCKSFIHQLGFLSGEKRLSLNLLRKNTQLLRELKSLDDQTCRETHKIAVIYIGPNQQDKQSILSNELGSLDYEDFINSLAWTIDLETHEGFMGGLARNTKLKTAMYYANSTTEILFHVSTRMNCPQEDNKISKWRHLGNDSVQIIWSDHKKDYNRSILATEFADVLICIYPMKNSMFRIQIDKKQSIGLFGPLFDGAIVNKQVLPALVRATAINASRVLLSKISGFKEFYVHRAHAINNIIRTQTGQETFEEFLFDIYSPAPINLNSKHQQRDSDTNTLNSSSSSSARD